AEGDSTRRGIVISACDSGAVSRGILDGNGAKAAISANDGNGSCAGGFTDDKVGLSEAEDADFVVVVGDREGRFGASESATKRDIFLPKVQLDHAARIGQLEHGLADA